MYENDLTKLSNNFKLVLSKCLQPCKKSILNVELFYTEKSVCLFYFFKTFFFFLFFCFLENIIEVSDNQEAKEHSGSEEWVHLHNLGVCCRVRRLGWSTLWILCSGYFRSFHKMCQPHFGQISSIITWMNEDVIAWIIWIEYSVCFA